MSKCYNQTFLFLSVLSSNVSLRLIFFPAFPVSYLLHFCIRSDKSRYLHFYRAYDHQILTLNNPWWDLLEAIVKGLMMPSFWDHMKLKKLFLTSDNREPLGAITLENNMPDIDNSIIVRAMVFTPFRLWLRPKKFRQLVAFYFTLVWQVLWKSSLKDHVTLKETYNYISVVFHLPNLEKCSPYEFSHFYV